LYKISSIDICFFEEVLQRLHDEPARGKLRKEEAEERNAVKEKFKFFLQKEKEILEAK
jgi:hypothetical protein